MITLILISYIYLFYVAIGVVFADFLLKNMNIGGFLYFYNVNVLERLANRGCPLHLTFGRCSLCFTLFVGGILHFLFVSIVIYVNFLPYNDWLINAIAYFTYVFLVSIWDLGYNFYISILKKCNIPITTVLPIIKLKQPNI